MVKPRKMKLKYRWWRLRASNILKEHGEMPMHILMDYIPYLKFSPKNVNSATQLLLKDKRFVARLPEDDDGDMLPKSRDRGTYKVMIWGLADEN